MSLFACLTGPLFPQRYSISPATVHAKGLRRPKGPDGAAMDIQQLVVVLSACSSPDEQHRTAAADALKQVRRLEPLFVLIHRAEWCRCSNT